MILQIVIAGACLVDGFASGLFVGRKWAKSKVSSVGATIAVKETAVATEVAAVEAKVAPVVTVADTVVTDAKAIEAKIAAALQAAIVTA